MPGLRRTTVTRARRNLRPAVRLLRCGTFVGDYHKGCLPLAGGPLLPGVAVGCTNSSLEPNRRGPHCARRMNHTSTARLDETIACTQALIADQQACIDRLDAQGADSSRQQEFLATFKALLAVQEARRKKYARRRRPVMTWSATPAAPSMPATPDSRREVA